MWKKTLGSLCKTKSSELKAILLERRSRKLHRNVFLSQVKNFQNQEKGALRNLMSNKNKIISVNDTDKNLGATNADTVDVKTECWRQLYDTFMFTKLSEEAKEEFVRNIKFQLKSIAQKHLYRGSCSPKEAKFLESCLEGYKISHFYIIWKILKIHQSEGQLLQEITGFLHRPLFLWDIFLKNNYCKFNSILTDTVSLIYNYWRKNKIHEQH